MLSVILHNAKEENSHGHDGGSHDAGQSEGAGADHCVQDEGERDHSAANDGIARRRDIVETDLEQN